MAHRPPATVAVVPANDARGHKQLDGLLRELGPHDNLVLLRPGVSRNPRLWRVPNTDGWRRPGTVPGPRQIVVVVEEEVLGSLGWLEALLAVFVDTPVQAAAPWSNSSSGDELFLGVPYRSYEAEERTAFLAQVGDRGTAALAASHLQGPCLAFRATMLEDFGGLERLAKEQVVPQFSSPAIDGTVAIADGAYLHRLGDGTHRAPARLSGLLIVKNEEANLERCLTSLSGIVDEIVVYDTGSTDKTVELATELGARVIAGYWDDDFARARNAALAECSGEWVLAIDADEALSCPDPARFRDGLTTSSADVEGFLVSIDNLRGTDTATMLSHPACRLFRRSCGEWDGRIHEQVVARAGNRDLALQLTDHCRLTHWGYVQGAIAARDKGARNLRTAFGDLAGGSDLDLGDRLTSLGRSYLMASRLEEGLEITRRAIAVAARPSTERLARRALIEGLLALGRYEEALKECAALRALQQVPTIADAHAGAALLGLGRFEEALSCFARVVAGVDDDGFDYEPSFVAAPRAECLSELGRHDEAATLLLDTLRDRGGLDAHLGLLADCLTHAGRSLGEIAEAIPEERVRAFVPQLLQLRPEIADAVLEEWIAHRPGNLAVLAAAGRIGTRLPIARQLIWSTRFRELGLSSSCPLVQSTTETGMDRLTRTISAAVALRVFADPRARQAFVALALALDVEEQRQLLSALDELGGEAATLAGTLFAVVPTRTRVDQKVNPYPRNVLVGCGDAPALRGYCLAALLSAHGHDVTLVQPQPAAPAEELLRALAVSVHGFTGEAEKGLLSLLAQLGADRRYDTVILDNSALSLNSAIGRLFPVAHLLALAGETTDALPLRLLARSAQAEELVEIERPLDWSAAFGPLPSPPLAARTGIVIVADAMSAPEWTERLFAALEQDLAGEAVALIGGAAPGALAASHPGILALGPLADPTPWLAAARAALLLPGGDIRAWQNLAEQCGTPLIAPVAITDPDAVIASLRQAMNTTAPQPERADECSKRAASDDPLSPLGPVFSRPRRSGGRQVLLRGGLFGHDSLATVNRELALRLSSFPLDLTVCTPELGGAAEEVARCRELDVRRGNAQGPFDLEIRHAFPPDFTPAGHKLVLIQPWEFGGFPAEWIGPLRDVVDELWVPSNFVRECALKSGLSPSRVHVVPNGVDTQLFTPEGPRYQLRTDESVKLLFVGGLIERKGIDALLETYCATFTKDDDVCLVIKPFGSDSVYRNSTLEPDVRRAAAGGGAAIEIVDGDLSAKEMASLYRAADVLVHPYRGEGFGLPIAEAMACGLPVVVPDGGAALDFCDNEVAWMFAAREVPINPSEWTPSRAGAWWLEPSRTGLARALFEAVNSAELRRSRGARAATRIAATFTWERAAFAAGQRIEALLSERDVPTPGLEKGVPQEEDASVEGTPAEPSSDAFGAPDKRDSRPEHLLVPTTNRYS